MRTENESSGFFLLCFSDHWNHKNEAKGLLGVHNFRRFRKFPKASISFAMSVCLSVRKEEIISHRTDFSRNFMFEFFLKFVEKIPVPWKSDKNNGTLHEDQWEWEMFQTKTVEKIQVSLKSDKNNGTLHEDQYTS